MSNGELPILTGTNLMLRPMSLEDAAPLFQCWSHPEVAHWLGVPQLNSVDDARELIRWLLQMAQEEDSLRWSIVLPGGQVIGSCGYNSWQLRGAFRGEIGCELLPDFWGRGFMRESLTLVLDYGFRIMELNRLEAVCHPSNVRGAWLFTALGFQREGVLREYRHTETGFQDAVMYSLLSRDWLTINR
ncbi:GNAT family N-acetyltransferase [Paenibacillus sp. sgz500958]|uniref:GNAT family N-acetyltransferase n=1 Tax=Paenibacillus sp. sgz500958 TaxID=3242475 RepID=UPI0036D2C32C